MSQQFSRAIHDLSSTPWRAPLSAHGHDDQGVAGVAIALFNRRDR
jgi:hypothetical protein